MKKRIIALVVVIAICTTLFTGCETRTINAVYPPNGETVSLANEEVTEFWTNYTKCLSQQYSDCTDKYKMVGVNFQWENSGEADYYYVDVSENKDMSDFTRYTALSNSMQVDDLMPNSQYYWQVTAVDGENAVKSDVFNFKTLDTVRTVFICDSVTNTRDLGGVVNTSGQKMKTGIVYRGGYIDNITDEGKYIFTEVLGIKTDLDLRTPGEGKAGDGNGSPAGENVKYYNWSGPYYTLVANEEYMEAMANEIRVFTDESNYPIYFHCAIGRDRTGTLAYILGAICGLSDEDLVREYEMSGFSKHGGDDMQGMVENQLGALIAYFDTFAGETTQEKVSVYLRYIGITDEELDKIRSIMLE